MGDAGKGGDCTWVKPPLYSPPACHSICPLIFIYLSCSGTHLRCTSDPCHLPQGRIALFKMEYHLLRLPDSDSRVWLTGGVFTWLLRCCSRSIWGVGISVGLPVWRGGSGGKKPRVLRPPWTLCAESPAQQVRHSSSGFHVHQPPADMEVRLICCELSD